MKHDMFLSATGLKSEEDSKKRVCKENLLDIRQNKWKQESVHAFHSLETLFWYCSVSTTKLPKYKSLKNLDVKLHIKNNSVCPGNSLPHLRRLCEAWSHVVSNLLVPSSHSSPGHCLPVGGNPYTNEELVAVTETAHQGHTNDTKITISTNRLARITDTITFARLVSHQNPINRHQALMK